MMHNIINIMAHKINEMKLKIAYIQMSDEKMARLEQEQPESSEVFKQEARTVGGHTYQYFVHAIQSN